MITQNVTLSNALEVKYKEWNKILILDSAFQEPGPGPVNFVLFFFFTQTGFPSTSIRLLISRCS